MSTTPLRTRITALQPHILTMAKRHYRKANKCAWRDSGMTLREKPKRFLLQEVSLSDNLGKTPIFDLLTSCNTRWLALSFQTPSKFNFKDL